MTTQLQQRASVSAPTTISDVATIYGCCGLFDRCADNDLMSLSFEGASKFLDWIGWERTDVCLIKKNFITFVRPEAAENGTRTSGHITDPCGDSKGVEWGSCDFTLEDFGHLRRHGPVRDATKSKLRLCETQPRYRLDMSPITSDAEYDMRLATEAILQDLKYDVISGSKMTGGSFDGLESLIKTGYVNSNGKSCKIMDSIVIDWNGNSMNGGAGITWNGMPVGATYDFVDVLMAVFRRVIDRIQLSPPLAAQTLGEGDMIFVGPTHLLRSLLDHFTCWSVCPGAQYNEANLQVYEARQFRLNLMGGMFGAGKIFIDGYTIHLCPYEWGLVKGPTLSDAYLLTGQIGNVKLLQGQYNDLGQAIGEDSARGAAGSKFAVTDGGRLLTWINSQNTCVQREIEMQTRLLAWAPWAQVRFQDVKATQIGGVLSPDPWATSFFPETSFITPECAV